jgi:molybdenum cofactor guanylyltransferase
MGQDKSFLMINNETIISRLVNMICKLFENVCLITNEPEKYDKFNIGIYEDIYKFKGPLAGIHSGLTHSKTQRNFVISCDIPLISEDIIRFIVDYKSDRPVVISRADGFIQQLCGIYDKSCLPEIEEIFRTAEQDENRDERQAKRKCKVLSLVYSLEGTIIDIEKEFAAYRPNTFLNMNKPDDYDLLLNILAKNNRL